MQCLVCTWHPEIQKNFLKNLFLRKTIKLTSWGRPKYVMLQVSLLDIFRTFIGRFSKMKEYAMTNVLVSNTYIWWTKSENITTGMCFVFIFKYVTFMLPSWRRLENFTNRTSLWDLYQTSLGRFSENLKQLTL